MGIALLAPLSPSPFPARVEGRLARACGAQCGREAAR